MSISSIGSSSLGSLYQTGGVAQNSTIGQGMRGPEQDGDGPGKPGGPGRPGGPLMQAVVQTLSDMGIMTGNTPVTAAGSGSGLDGTSDSTNAANNPALGEALHAFMHSLFQALHQPPGGVGGMDEQNAVSGPPPSSALSPALGYQAMDSRLQGLSQSLASGNSTASSDALSAAFQNLLLAVPEDEEKKKKDLQAFLAQLMQTLQQGATIPGLGGAGGMAGVGSFISTSA